jgi:hypothetical protein
VELFEGDGRIVMVEASLRGRGLYPEKVVLRCGGSSWLLRVLVHIHEEGNVRKEPNVRPMDEGKNWRRKLRQSENPLEGFWVALGCYEVLSREEDRRKWSPLPQQ